MLRLLLHQGNIEAAQKRLAAILTEDRDDIRALLCLATSLMVQKLVPKARNQLKRIAKMQYRQSVADEFVKAWLMLADIYITSYVPSVSSRRCVGC